jgi:hypothetical protein
MNLQAQETYILSGTVTDSITGEPLPGTSVFLVSESAGTQADEKGHYTIAVKKGMHVIRFSFIGYHAFETRVDIKSNQQLNAILAPATTQTQSVIITARNPGESTESTKTGLVEFTGKEMKRMPTLMGETDVIRVLNYSPGVQSAGDGNSGYYVRGGNVDQNLILLDNAIVYNPSHVLGFFSVFNSDIISSATLIKSGIPASYGGRLSSVLAIKTIDGDFERHHVSANIGLLFSSISVQGPIARNKISYLFSFRKSYVNAVATPLVGFFAKNDGNSLIQGNQYDMYDLNAKITWKPDYRNRFTLMFYKGRDHFSLENSQIDYSNLINWGNTLISLNWNHQVSDSSYLTSSLNYSNYDFNYGSSQFILDMNLYSSVRNANYKLEYSKRDFYGGILKAGLDAKYYRFIPNKFLLTVNEVDLDYGSYQDLQAVELAAYGSWERDISDRLRIYAGLRISNYDQLGPYSKVTESGQEGLKDTITYNQGKIVKSYTNPEPRISLRYQTSPFSSIKASYTRNYQYIHVVSSSSVTLPSDIWIPSTEAVRPQDGDQFTLGYYHNFSQNMYVGSVEAYYKSLHNQVEMLYGLGASFQETSFEKSLTRGKGYSSGIEFFLQKRKGELTGSIGYAFSYSERKFDEINNGLWFPAKYDRRHEINVVSAYTINARWDVSVAFVYASGNAMTIPEQKYFIEGSVLNEYGRTNSFRMPAYHRMDLSLTYHLRARHLLESNLNFSVFNVYNRANPFLLFFEVKGDLQHYNLEVSARQVSIFPILPSLSWSFKF